VLELETESYRKVRMGCQVVLVRVMVVDARYPFCYVRWLIN